MSSPLNQLHREEPACNTVPSNNRFQISWITVGSWAMSHILVNLLWDLEGLKQGDVILNLNFRLRLKKAPGVPLSTSTHDPEGDEGDFWSVAPQNTPLPLQPRAGRHSNTGGRNSIPTKLLTGYQLTTQTFNRRLIWRGAIQSLQRCRESQKC